VAVLTTNSQVAHFDTDVRSAAINGSDDITSETPIPATGATDCAPGAWAGDEGAIEAIEAIARLAAVVCEVVVPVVTGGWWLAPRECMPMTPRLNSRMSHGSVQLRTPAPARARGTFPRVTAVPRMPLIIPLGGILVR